MKKTVRKVTIILLVLVALVVLSSSLVVTHPNEFSVIRQFGKVISVRETPGLSFRMPFIQTTAKVPNTVLLYDLPMSDVITQDKKTMVADSFALWRITNPQLFIQTLNGSIPDAEARLSTIVYNSMKNTISARSQADVISGRDGELAADIKTGVGDTLEQYGIELIAVETKHLDLPDDNKAAVYQRMISERNNIAASFAAQGESEAKKIRSEADKEVDIMLSQADAKAEALVAEGEAEYMRILSAAYNDPGKTDFYRFVRSLDAAKTSLKDGSKTLFLTPDSPLAQVFYNAD